MAFILQLHLLISYALTVASGEQDCKAMNRESPNHQQETGTFYLECSVYLKLVHQKVLFLNTWKNDSANIPQGNKGSLHWNGKLDLLEWCCLLTFYIIKSSYKKLYILKFTVSDKRWLKCAMTLQQDNTTLPDFVRS